MLLDGYFALQIIKGQSNSKSSETFDSYISFMISLTFFFEPITLHKPPHHLVIPIRHIFKG